MLCSCASHYGTVAVLLAVPVGECLDLGVLLVVDALVALDEGQVGLGRDVGGAAVALEVLHAALGHAVLERAHALHHLRLHLARAVHLVAGQEVLRHWGGRGRVKVTLGYT